MNNVTDTPLTESELCPNELLEKQEAAYARDIARLQKRQHEFVTVDCPTCDSAEKKRAFTKFNFEFQRCVHCKTIYMSPRPSEEVMADYYSNSENYAYWAKHIFPASENARREKVHKPWLDKIASYCQQYGAKKGTLVEVGPGFGTFSSLATETGYFNSVLAIEPTPELADACRKRGVKVIEKRVEDASDALEDADVVVAFEVLEHLFNPNVFVSSLSQALKTGALVVFSCPNGEGFDISLLEEKSLAVDSEHVNLMNPTSLSLLMEKHGFTVLDCSTPGRLDSEFVREAALKGDIQLDVFLNKILVEEWDNLGWPFQQFLAANGLSSHMWIVAQK
ncbi:class I SAM-dependent methyltransferase [Kiloniella majae]|uniref:class I SAM-dependent methyltransferase n=1 Tax=Kiloniella majae TaxID=1938558 RepID=UPI0015C4F41A|nr:class I SAM-dependent methyltransferase [Kiloniella majae]